MINEKIDHFDFWLPVVFTEQPPARNFLTNLAWRLGNFADHYAYLGSHYLEVSAERIDARSMAFEAEEVKTSALGQTALKATTYVLTLLILPVLALTIKAIYKFYLNTHIAAHTVKETPNEWIAEKKIGLTKIVLLSGNLMDETTDAIVNAANARLTAGGGVCGAVYDHAGEGVFEECVEILKKQNQKSLNCGQAVLTSGGDLAPRVQVIVHAVGPNYNTKKEKDNGPHLIYQTYYNSLELITSPQDHADQVSSLLKTPEDEENQKDPEFKEIKPLRSIAFPSISTGIYGCPVEVAAPNALRAVSDFIKKHPKTLDEVRFVFLPPKKTTKPKAGGTEPAKPVPLTDSEVYEKALEQLGKSQKPPGAYI